MFKPRTLLDMFSLSTKPIYCCVLVDVSIGGYNVCLHGLISEEHRELQQLHTGKKEEYERVVLKLQSRMKRANDELEQVRDSLRTLKEANGHG